jgi:hypothetical protein
MSISEKMAMNSFTRVCFRGELYCRCWCCRGRFKDRCGVADEFWSWCCLWPTTINEAATTNDDAPIHKSAATSSTWTLISTRITLQLTSLTRRTPTYTHTPPNPLSSFAIWRCHVTVATTGLLQMLRVRHGVKHIFDYPQIHSSVTQATGTLGYLAFLGPSSSHRVLVKFEHQSHLYRDPTFASQTHIRRSYSTITHTNHLPHFLQPILLTLDTFQ